MTEQHYIAFHNIAEEGVSLPDTVCPECGSVEFKMLDYSLIWHDGNIHCAQCGKFIRRFDAG
jgi:uncharacterized Zn finger protein (UPF0148 family)